MCNSARRARHPDCPRDFSRLFPKPQHPGLKPYPAGQILGFQGENRCNPGVGSILQSENRANPDLVPVLQSENRCKLGGCTGFTK
jgi:hypothetical protein